MVIILEALAATMLRFWAGGERSKPAEGGTGPGGVGTWFASIDSKEALLEGADGRLLG